LHHVDRTLPSYCIAQRGPAPTAGDGTATCSLKSTTARRRRSTNICNETGRRFRGDDRRPHGPQRPRARAQKGGSAMGITTIRRIVSRGFSQGVDSWNLESARHSALDSRGAVTSGSHTSRRDTKDRRRNDGDGVAWHGPVAWRGFGFSRCPAVFILAALERKESRVEPLSRVLAPAASSGGHSESYRIPHICSPDVAPAKLLMCAIAQCW